MESARRIDLGITYLPVPHAGIEFTEVTRIHMNVFGLPRFRSMPRAERPFVVPLLPAVGTPSKVVGLDGWPDHRIDRRIQFRVTLMESALELCRQGRAVAFLPDFVVRLHNEHVRAERKLVPLDSALPEQERRQSVYLVQRRGMRESSLHRQVARSLRRLKAPG